MVKLIILLLLFTHSVPESLVIEVAGAGGDAILALGFIVNRSFQIGNPI